MFDDKNQNENNNLENGEASTPQTERFESSGPDNGGKKTSFVHKRSFKFGSMATAFTAIFVVIVILVNVGLTLLSQRFNLSLDLTNTKSYNLSADTIKYIDKVKQPVVIKVFAKRDDFITIGNKALLAPAMLMEQYHKYNPEITVEWIDTDKNVTAVAAYKNESISQYDVIVSTTGSDNKEHYKHISVNDLVITQTDSSTGSSSVVGNKAEQQIDSAIDYVTSTVHPTIAFTSGHNEADASGYQSLLKTGNYTVTTVNTTSSKIDESASAIAIVDPQVDFSTAEIDKIDKFLKNGGKYGKNIFIYLDPHYDNLKNLQEYISEWGVSVGKGVIYDSTNSFDNNVYDAVATDVDTTTAGSNISSNIGTDIRICKPLTVLFSSKDYRSAKSIITTQDSSKLLTGSTPSSSDKSGSFTAMTLSTWSDSTGANKSNMVVSGSYEIFDTDILNSPSKNNAKVLIGISNTLMAKKSAVTVEDKYDETTTLSLTTIQSQVISAIFLPIIPILLLVLGFVVWFRRRHL